MQGLESLWDDNQLTDTLDILAEDLPDIKNTRPHSSYGGERIQLSLSRLTSTPKTVDHIPNAVAGNNDTATDETFEKGGLNISEMEIASDQGKDMLDSNTSTTTTASHNANEMSDSSGISKLDFETNGGLCSGTLGENECCEPGSSQKPRPETYPRNINKRLRNEGRPYLRIPKNKSGQKCGLPIVVGSKLGEEIKGCSCIKFKCAEVYHWQDIRKHYWSLGNHNRQSDFIRNHVVQQKTISNTNGNIMYKRLYYLPGKDHTERINVCKTFFIHVLNISAKRVDNVLEKVKQHPDAPIMDMRGRKLSSNKTSKSRTKEVVEHIKSFPVVESHYCRKDSRKLYLGAELSIGKMYSLYKSCSADPVSRSKYRSIFKEFNYGFHVPKKNLCAECQAYKNTKNPTPDQVAKYTAHIQRKEEFREVKNKDKERAKVDNNFAMATFDMQQVLLTPKTDASPVYYSRKLNTYNLTIFDMKTNHARNYVWDETNGKRGSCEVGSVLYRYIETLPSHISELELISDKCGGQNQNMFIVTMMVYTLQNSTSLKVIHHKFPEQGHSQNEGDSVHARIEANKKHAEIMVPREWYNIIRTAKRSQPYSVIPVDYDDIYDFKRLHRDMKLNIKVDVDGMKITWRRVMWFKFEKLLGEVTVQYSYSHNSVDLVYLQMRSKRNSRNCSFLQPPPLCPDLHKRYDKRIPVSDAKKADLMKLCRIGVIPSDYHAYYASLPASSDVCERLPIPDAYESDGDTDAE